MARKVDQKMFQILLHPPPPEKFSLVLMEGLVEGQACADPGAKISNLLAFDIMHNSYFISMLEIFLLSKQ